MRVLKEFGVEKVEGEVGIEIEVEIPDQHQIPGELERMKWWKAEHDGSLRGRGVEYVLRKPVTREDVPVALNYLKNLFDESGDGVIPLDSGRAGLHVHVNVQDLNMSQVMNFLCLYLVFEEALVDWCGKDRVGNLFCLRVQDAEGLIPIVRNAVQSGNYRRTFATDAIRYAAVNLKALTTYGSMEFRAMRSTIDVDTVMEWVSMLLKLKDAAVKYGNPQDIVEALSREGTHDMFTAVFGEDTSLEYSDRAMMEGVRHSQTIAYATDDWSIPDKDSHEALVRLHDKHGLSPHYNHRRKLSELLDKAVFEADPMASAYLDHYRDDCAKRVVPPGMAKAHRPAPRVPRFKVGEFNIHPEPLDEELNVIEDEDEEDWEDE